MNGTCRDSGEANHAYKPTEDDEGEWCTNTVLRQPKSTTESVSTGGLDKDKLQGNSWLSKFILW